jgi:hypothetical protein
MKSQDTARRSISLLLVAALVTMVGLAPIVAQVRAGRRGAVVSGEEGYAAVGRHGNVVTGEDVDVQGAAVGRRGAVVVGEEGAAAVGRYGNVVVADRYESYDAWKAVAAVGAGIAIGTMLAKPPAAAAPVVVSQTTYLYQDGVFYTKVMSSGAVVYQVVAPPAGAIIATLPAGCKSVRVGNASYTQCGPTYYTRVSTGYQVVVLK